VLEKKHRVDYKVI